MAPISIKNQEEANDGWEFTVETPSGTTHEVSLQEDYYLKLTGGDVSPEKLIFASFAFLLDNEPADAILKEFSLSDIETYFPAFSDKIKDRLQDDQ